MLEIASLPRTLAELIEPTGRTDRTKFRDQVLRRLLENGLLAMTILDKPTVGKTPARGQSKPNNAKKGGTMGNRVAQLNDD